MFYDYTVTQLLSTLIPAELHMLEVAEFYGV